MLQTQIKDPKFIHLYIPGATLKALNNRAKLMGCSRSELVRDILKRSLLARGEKLDEEPELESQLA